MATIPPGRVAEYQLRHVWSTGTDADTSEYDDVHYSMPPGVVISGIGRATHRAFAPPGTPSLDNELPNEDGRYAPYGILGGFVGRGPETTFDANWGTDVLGNADDVLGNDPDVLGNGRMNVRLFTGNIDTAPQSIDTPMASVQVNSLGRISRLNDETAEKPLIPLYETIRTDEAITLVLDAIGWPATDRVIDEGDTELLYFWADGRTSAADLIQRILGSEGVPACAYEDGDGYFHFEGRQFRANNPRSVNIQWSLFDGPASSNDPLGNDPGTLGNDPNVLGNGPLEAILFHMIPSQWASNPDETVKSVKTTVNVRTATALPTKVGEYGGPLVLGPSEVRDVEYTNSDPFKDAIVPDLVNDYAVSIGSVTSVSLLETSGQTVRVRYVAGAGGATIVGVTSDGPQLRATILETTAQVPITSSIDTSSNYERFRSRDLTIDIWPEITSQQALALCDNHVRRYQRPRDQMTVQIYNIDRYHIEAMLTMKISDRIQIRHTRASINRAFFIESMSHDLTFGYGLHRLTLFCERVTDDVTSRFGTARFGFDTFSE